MRLQDYMVEVTRDTMREAFKYASNVPADKLEWKPLETGRSVLDLCREMALCPTWCLDIVGSANQPDWSEESMAAIKLEQEALLTVEDCRVECERRLAALFDHFRAMPDDRLSEQKWLPFSGGREFTMPEMMDYPRWNFTYHLGQIAYVQTLYGDREMY